MQIDLLTTLQVFNPELWLLFVDENGNRVEEKNVVGVADIGSERIHAIVSKHTVEAARQHFGCDSLDAVPLENQGAKGTIGAHWDSRYMQVKKSPVDPSSIR